MGRFLCGRQVLVIFSVYLASQVTAFADLKTWPFTDVPLPQWFYVGVCTTGLPAVIVICAVSQLLPQLVAVSHPDIVLRAPAAIAWVSLALGVEYAGLARAASLLTWFIRKCLPESYMVPYNREIEECARAVFDDFQDGAPEREFARGTKVTFNTETGEGTIEWAAEDKDAASAHADAEAGKAGKMRTTKWQTMM